jgi:cob(I)alamin adenosyltransferase
MAIRAVGHGLSVCIIQFLKGGSYTGEVVAAKYLPNLHIYQYGQGCIHPERIGRGSIKCDECRYCFSSSAIDKKTVEEAFKTASEAVTSGKYDLVILDELLVALDKSLLELDTVLELISRKSSKTELVLTGRGAQREIIGVADLVTEMKEVKHPIKKGILGREGIDY